MSKRPYQHLPPLEHRPDGYPYRITPPQKRRASGLIRRECCNCEDGNCLALENLLCNIWVVGIPYSGRRWSTESGA